MEPAAAAAWKNRFRTRVAKLAANCAKTGEKLATARPFIEAPIHTAGAAGARANLETAVQRLAEAQNYFSLGAMYMLTAQFLALRGGSPNPAQPLPSIQHLAANTSLRHALVKLELAYPLANEGCELIDWCRAVLAVIYCLLDNPGLPDVDAVIAAEHTEALRLLNIAARRLQICTMAANGALQDASGPW